MSIETEQLESQQLSLLEDILSEAEQRPDNVSLLHQQISLMRQLQMTSESLDVVQHLSSLIMLDENTWLAYFEQLLNSTPNPLTLDSLVTLLERFDQAEGDYLSSTILQQHLDFVLSCWSAKDMAPDAVGTLSVDQEVAEFLNEETVRSMLGSIARRGRGLLFESDALWSSWREWELTLLERATDKTSAIEHLHAFFLERLSLPHSTMNSSFDAYSSFCSQNCPNAYEQRMVKATEVSQAAKHAYSQEKRYGQTREDLEQQIVYATDFAARAQAFIAYTKWEADHRAQLGGKGRAPTADPSLTRSIFERTVCLYASTAGSSRAIVDESELRMRQLRKVPAGKGKSKSLKNGEEMDILGAQIRTLGETIRAYKDAEASIWSQYAGWASKYLSPAEADVIRTRAVRACPQNGETWSRLLLYKELDGNSQEELAALFDRALGLGQLSTPSERTLDLAQVFIARAASEGRQQDGQTASSGVMATILQGLDMLQKVNKDGDTSMLLEKFLLDWVETRAPELLEEALSVIDKPSRARASAYQMVLLRTAVAARRGDITTARDTYKKAIQRSDLDWPEAVYEAFLRFENIHGDLSSVLAAIEAIAREQEKLTRRREKAALEQAEASQIYVQQAEQEDVIEKMDVDKVGGEAQPASDADAHFKRDREHTTILVAGILAGTEPNAIEAFFVECGPIREITILDEGTEALVEFRTADSVPAALTRDHKRISDQEVSVSMLWKSTLFVTNFSRETDDAAIRALFGQYGRILQTRWPSRKYADSRRFCYVTMDSPAVTQEALLLHGYKTGEGFGLTVLVSDPSAKTKRNDTIHSTLFVGGLTAKTTEVDVRDLLRGHGSIQSLKLGWDPIKRVCKGFAFVEMATEADAQAALSLHGSQFQGRYLKVELSDPNHANKRVHERDPGRAADKRLRSVKLLNLPVDAQEGLLQQALEKLVPVKRLEVFGKDREAVVELEAQADVGKLLLRTEPFVFDGVTIEIVEQGRRPPPGKPVPTMVPRAARRAKVIGKARPAVTSPAPVVKQDQGDFRALVAARNQERGAAGEKRKSENDEPDAKRMRP